MENKNCPRRAEKLRCEIINDIVDKMYQAQESATGVQALSCQFEYVPARVGIWKGKT